MKSVVHMHGNLEDRVILSAVMLVAVMSVTKYTDTTYFFTHPLYCILMVNTVLFTLITALRSFDDFS